ncbi:hypothetical protein TNCV_278331 [Trichonephila clavipes]|nr:hypothetical protein TNCV_278331 [Trichonephila clavipes]
MSVLLAASDRGPLRLSMALHITILNPLIPYSANSQLDLEGRKQQYYHMINRNPGTLQFDLYQSQKDGDTHFLLLT